MREREMRRCIPLDYFVFEELAQYSQRTQGVDAPP